MSGARLAGFDAFVAERGDALVALARGLCARDEDAEELLEAALADVVRRWRRPTTRADPSAATVRAMVRRAGRRSRRARGEERPAVVHGEADLDDLAPPDAGRTSGPGVTGTSGGLPGGPTPAEQDPVAALRAVPVEQRAVLLLRWLEGLDDAAVAAVLGVGPAVVDERARAALAAIGLEPS